MRRLIALGLASLVFAVPASQAGAAAKPPTGAQFAALKKQLAKDEKKIKTLTNAVNGLVGVILCQNAITADALQGTWQSMDNFAVSLGKPAIFGTQTPINDDNACSDFKITRSHAVPPNVSVFSSLATLLAG